MVMKIFKNYQNVSFQQKFHFTTMKTEHDAANTAKFWVAYMLTKQEKSLIDSELIKSCLIEPAKEMYLKEINFKKYY